MVEIAAEKGMTMTAEEVRGLLREMHGDDEFDDIELDSVALACDPCADGSLVAHPGPFVSLKPIVAR